MTTGLPGRRYGRFAIDIAAMERDHTTALAALDGCIVLRAEASYASHRVEYLAWHPEFDQLDVLSETPLYRAVVSGGRRLCWERAAG